MERHPAIRARSSRDSLFWADNYEGADGRVRAAMPAESREVVEHALPTAWIPIEHDKWVVRAIVEAHGREGARQCWRDFMQDHANAPMLRGILQMSIRMFGLNPGSIAKIAPKAWGNVYRGFCDFRPGERGDKSAALLMEDIHPDVLEVEEYLLCFQSVFEGFCDIFGGGTVEMEVDRPRRSARLQLHW